MESSTVSLKFYAISKFSLKIIYKIFITGSNFEQMIKFYKITLENPIFEFFTYEIKYRNQTKVFIKVIFF